MTDIRTVADVTALPPNAVSVSFTLTETVTSTRTVTLPLATVRGLIESDGWTEDEPLTGDLDMGDVRDALTDAFSESATAERDTHTVFTVDSVAVR